MAKKETKCRDWKHIVLFAMNIVMIGLLVFTLLVYVLPTYRTGILTANAPAIYAQCQTDIARALTNDLNTQGFTQLTIGEQTIRLQPMQ